VKPFWLSHHREEERDRTYAFGSVHLCARCLGLYPALLLTLGLGLGRGRPSFVLGLGLILPGLYSWALGLVRPWAGSNPGRTLSGALLGVGLGLSLREHLEHPWPPVLLLQGAVVTGVALPLLVLRRLGKIEEGQEGGASGQSNEASSGE
jgi:hypothetical protein